MKTRLATVTVHLIAALFFILWIYAGVTKMLDPEFSDQLHKSPYLDKVADLVLLTLPAGEIVIAFLLIFSRTRLLGLYLSFFTMFLFTGYIYTMLNFSHYKACSCGGILEKMDWDTHLIFNVVFTVLASVAIMLWRKPHVGQEQSAAMSYTNSGSL